MGKRKEAELEIVMTATNIPALNYKVYHLKLVETILCFMIAFVVGAVTGYIFYGGIAVDTFGNPTQTTHILNWVITCSAGLIAGIAFLPMRKSSVIAKRKNELRYQFRELLDSLVTSMGSGKNIPDAFRFAKEDLGMIYEDDAYIMKELEIILAGITNNIGIESLLSDFGKRSDNKDINSFARVFEISYRKGGNMKDVIRSTQEIINDKMEIELEIETIVTANKNEQKIMMAMPIALIGVIKGMSPEMAANYVTPSGLMATTVAIGMFVAAYFIGKAVLDIRV